MEKIVAIREEKLKKLILEIYDLRDKASKALSDLEVLVNSSETYFDSDDGRTYREKFKLLSQNFPIFLSNIEGYGQDLEMAVQRFSGITSANVDIFKNVMYTGNEKLEDTDAMAQAIARGWQGQSRDNFLDQFEKGIRTVQSDLKSEYSDLMMRLSELTRNYYEQDAKMVN